VFPGSSGQPIDYHNWRARVWGSLLKKAGVSGKFHMLRHFFVTALIQSGVNAKVAQTLAGHHSASFTLDQYADAVPEQLEEAGEKVAQPGLRRPPCANRPHARVDSRRHGSVRHCGDLGCCQSV
jgi:integrase